MPSDEEVEVVMGGVRVAECCCGGVVEELAGQHEGWVRFLDQGVAWCGSSDVVTALQMVRLLIGIARFGRAPVRQTTIFNNCFLQRRS